MNKSIKGTQTEKNLLTSFAGESQARNRYTFFASVAKKEGFEQISDIFTETANQEKEHAKRMFKYLEGGTVEITACYPAGVIGTTLENLQAAANGEHEEWAEAYPKFAEIAQKEGFPEIAAMYRNISVAEKNHDEHEVVDQTLAVFLAHPRRVGRLQVAEEVLAQNGDVEDLPFVLGVRERERESKRYRR